jgi:CBS-domain-containing membrane protein
MKLERNWRDYWRKWRGTTAGGPPRVSYDEVFWSWVGAVLGIGAVAWIGGRFFAAHDLHLMIGSFGASAVLVYGAPRSPLAQPRNLIGGHVISALIGVTCWQLFHLWPGVAQAIAVATALIATLGSTEIERLGYWYVLMPATIGPFVLLLVALVVNNLPRSRRYPEVWF